MADEPIETKSAVFHVENGALVSKMQQAELVPRIHPFTANAALTAVLLTCTLGSRSDPASVSYLLTDITPQWRAFAHAASAALERPRAHSSGRVVLPFSCAGVCQDRQAPVTVHRMAYYKRKTKILCFFIDYYTRYRPVLQEPLQFFLFFYTVICKGPSRKPERAFASALHQFIPISAQPCSSAERRAFAAGWVGAGAVR